MNTENGAIVVPDEIRKFVRAYFGTLAELEVSHIGVVRMRGEQVCDALAAIRISPASRHSIAVRILYRKANAWDGRTTFYGYDILLDAPARHAAIPIRPREPGPFRPSTITMSGYR